jgi:hypothetical protein
LFFLEFKISKIGKMDSYECDENYKGTFELASKEK